MVKDSSDKLRRAAMALGSPENSISLCYSGSKVSGSGRGQFFAMCEKLSGRSAQTPSSAGLETRIQRYTLVF